MFYTFVYIAAAKQNLATKDCTQEKIETELQTWFGNARDRGAGGRKKQQQHQLQQQQQPNNNIQATNQ